MFALPSQIVNVWGWVVCIGLMCCVWYAAMGKDSDLECSCSGPHCEVQNVQCPCTRLIQQWQASWFLHSKRTKGMLKGGKEGITSAQRDFSNKSIYIYTVQSLSHSLQLLFFPSLTKCRILSLSLMCYRKVRDMPNSLWVLGDFVKAKTTVLFTMFLFVIYFSVLIWIDKIIVSGK